MIIYPVIYYIRNGAENLTGSRKVKYLSEQARDALKVSAHKNNISIGKLEKDDKGAPLPFGNFYWSVSHKSECVAAVISNYHVGIDVEKIQPHSERLFSYVADNAEWELLGGDNSWINFFRIWTAKEAVLKAIGIGISGLRICKVITVNDNKNMNLEYKNNMWSIEHYYYKDFIASVTKSNDKTEWIVI